MNRYSWFVVPVALLGLVAVALGQNPTPAGRSIAVEGAQVTLIQDSRIPAEEMGVLVAIHVKDGHAVELGQLLASIDNRETLAKQKIAQGELDAASVQYESDAELDVAEKAVLVAKAEWDAAQEIRQRTPGAVSDAELRKLRFQWERSQAAVRAALTEKEVNGKMMHIKQAQLEATEFELDRRQIKARYNGEVDEVYKKVGDWVQPGEPIMRVMALDRLRVVGFVRSSLATPADVLGKPVVIRIYSGGEREPYTVRGTIGFASSVIEGTGDRTRGFRIWAEVDNQRISDRLSGLETWAIQPGSEATMTIDLAARPTAAAPSRPNLTPTSAPGGTPAPLRPATEGPQFRLPTPAAPAAPGRAFSFRPVLTGPGDERATDETKSTDDKPEPIRAAPTSKSRER